MRGQIITQTIPGGFSAIAGAFVISTLEHIIPWLITTMAVILTDLFFGVRKSLLMGDEVRFSRAIRATMGKMVTYFAFVVMVCMINIAANNEFPIEKYSCLLVCAIEGCSIIGNILKPKGIVLSIKGVLGVLCSKLFRVNKDDIKDIIKDENSRQDYRKGGY